MKKLFCTISIIAASLFAHSQVQQWVARYNGPDSLYDEAIAIDVKGCIYVTGRTQYTMGDMGENIAILRYLPNGILKWSVLVTGHHPTGIVIDPSCNVYVTGTSNSGNFLTVKYDSIGIQQWAVTDTGTSIPNAITIDKNNNIYVTGTGSTLSNIATIKYNSQGNKQWIAAYNGHHPGFARGNSITVDNVGNVYITGLSFTGTSFDYVTIKYNSSGIQQWTRLYNGPGNGFDEPLGIALDKQSTSVYITGRSTGAGTGLDYATIRYDNNGTIRWVQRYGSLNDDDQAVAIAVDSRNSITVTGKSKISSNNDFATIQYNKDGTLRWAQLFNGPADANDFATALAIDNKDNVYITGASTGIGSNLDYATLKYSSEGKLEWTQRYNGSANGIDQANDIAVDSTGNVYVTGLSQGTATNFDFATIKYRQQSTGQTLGILNQNKQLLKNNLKLIARSIAGLMNDNYFKSLVSTQAVQNQNFRVRFDTLIAKSNAQEVNLKQLILNSASSAGLTPNEIQQVSDIINSFKVGNISFFPQIVFPALNPVFFSANGWDGQTPCYTAISLFYAPSAKIPAYNTTNNQSALNLSALNLSSDELFKRPVWYISLDHNIDLLYVNGKFMGSRNPLYQAFKQIEWACECYGDPDISGNPQSFECLRLSFNDAGGCSGCTVGENNCFLAIPPRPLETNCSIQ